LMEVMRSLSTAWHGRASCSGSTSSRS